MLLVSTNTIRTTNQMSEKNAGSYLHMTGSGSVSLCSILLFKSKYVWEPVNIYTSQSIHRLTCCGKPVKFDCRFLL